jgi:hypothetical protein
MANSTSKTSKAKTKTTNRPAAAKETSKAATKVTKKPVKSVNRPVTKAAADKPTVAAKSAPVVAGKEIKKDATTRRGVGRALTAQGLRKLHLISAVVFVVLAVLAAVLMSDTAQQLMRGHLTSDALASQTQTVFAPAQHVMASIQLRWVVVATMLVSAALAAWRYYSALRERRALDSRISAWRWIDFAVTGALVIETIAFLSGMQDLVTLKLLGTLVASSAVFAWIAERENANANRVVKGSFIASFVTGALALLAINAYAVATIVYGIIRSPWYVYALYALAVVTALALALNQIREYRRVGSWGNYLFVERNYIVINLLAKVAFAVILIVGLLK